MEKKFMAIGLSAVMIILFLALPMPIQHNGTDGTKTIGQICVYGDFHDKGQNVFLGCSYNTVTNIAKNQTRDIRMDVLEGVVGDTVAVNYTWQFIELSTETTAVNATVATCGSPVTGNGLDIIGGSIAEVGTSVGNYSITHKFEASGTQAGIAKVCLSNMSTSAGALMASVLLSSTVDLVNNENLTVIYYVAES